MSIIKCIVVHLTDNERHTMRLRVAIGLAKRFDAHLNVVFAKPEADYPAASIGRAMSMHYLEEAKQEANARLEQVKAEIDELCGDLPSWERHDQFGDVAKIMSHFAHVADLIVVEQPPEERLEDNFMLHMTDQLVMSAGCPMLLLPAGWSESEVGTRVLIAWKNNREASLAVRGSLDFLREAEQVLILAAEDSQSESPGADLTYYLGHQKIRSRVVGTSRGEGADFLRVAERHRCNLLVMGAYAHSRFRELLLGGSTDYIMRHPTIPVLMRH